MICERMKILMWRVDLVFHSWIPPFLYASLLSVQLTLLNTDVASSTRGSCYFTTCKFVTGNCQILLPFLQVLTHSALPPSTFHPYIFRDCIPFSGQFGLEFSMQPRVASNPKQFSCLSLSSARITSTWHYPRLLLLLNRHSHFLRPTWEKHQLPFNHSIDLWSSCASVGVGL